MRYRGPAALQFLVQNQNVGSTRKKQNKILVAVMVVMMMMDGVGAEHKGQSPSGPGCAICERAVLATQKLRWSEADEP